MKRPRLLVVLIILLTLLALFVNVPNSIKLGSISKDIEVSPNALLKKFNINKDFAFREGLDLKGGVSITFKADVSELQGDEKDKALESAKAVIERRINLYGVSEPLIQTSKANNDYRIIVELPGVTDINQAVSLIGRTARLTFWEQGPPNAPVASPSAYPIGAVEVLGTPVRTNLSGADLRQSAVVPDPTSGKLQVQLRFSPEGGKKFADLTRRNTGKPIAIVLDNVVIEAPSVNEPILTGDAVITGSFTLDQAKALSTQLNAGALPVSLSVLEQRVIGPTLGAESLRKSLFAGLIGFVTIVVFMIALYGRLGIIAGIALLLYTLFTLAIFKLSSLTPYGITLTLAGIAGLILSIGMAVDANILIFERMREEERNGKSRQSAIELGFSKAWTSIRDSNVSTLITCAILYSFGTGIIRGFALVLAIGVLVSMFSAITVTRTLLRTVFRS